MLAIKGLLKVVSEEVQVSEKFRKRDFVIEDNASQYPQVISFQLVQDRCSLIDSYKVGDEINVNFNLRGREWKSPTGEVKYFNTLEAWKIELIATGKAPEPQANHQSNVIGGTNGSFQNSPESDDLPF